jgi:cell division protein FtsW
MADWWWSLDKPLIFMVLGLVMFGFMLVAAASPAIAARIGIHDGIFPKEWLFFAKHVCFVTLGLGCMFGVARLDMVVMRRMAMGLFVVSYGLLALTLVAGSEIKGSLRWLSLGPISLQPSEFIKPGFIIFCAWMFAQDLNPKAHIPGIPVALLALIWAKPC